MEFVRNENGEIEAFENGKSLGIIETTNSNEQVVGAINNIAEDS